MFVDRKSVMNVAHMSESYWVEKTCFVVCKGEEVSSAVISAFDQMY